MPRSLLLLCLALVSASSSAQSTSSQPPQQGAPAVPTIQAKAQLVIVDVVVKDSHQNPIHTLKPADFTLLESNQPQQIKYFEEHTALSPAETAQFPPLPKMPPGVFTNYTPVPDNGPINILLLDTLNTPMTDQAFVRDQLRKYLKSAPPGTRIAIFGLTTRLLLLQGFTSDPELLKTAIDRKRAQASPLLDDAVGGGGGPAPLSETLTNMGTTPGADIIANLQQFEAEQQSFQLQLRARYTLDAMNQLARYLSGIPGRKNLIWFSGSFPISILPDGDIQNPFAVVASSEDEFRETTNLLTGSQVAVYPVDARGLMTAPMYDASNSGAKYRNPRAFAKDQTKFFQQTAEEHATMQQMAQDTGGHAFYNTNGLSHAVAEAISEGSNYYTLAYTPTNTKWNGAYRKIQIKLRQPNLTLTYRRGYFADNPEEHLKHSTSSAATSAGTSADKPPDSIRPAMMHGAPTPTQIIFKASVLPIGGPPEDKLAPGNSAVPNLKGPYRRYNVSYAASPHDVTFSIQPNGAYQTSLQFLIFVYNQDGELLNTIGNTARGNLSPEAYAASLRTGLHFQQQISVPVKGESFLRIGVHDLSSDRIGALEVPVVSVKNLAPLPLPAATANTPAVTSR